MNKAGIWTSKEIWKFSDDSSAVNIENTSKNTLLRATSDDSVREVNAAATPIWKKGYPNAEGYFTLTCLKSQKVLTAVSDESFEMKGRVDWVYTGSRYFNFFLFHSISDHEFYASKVWVEETIDNVASKDMWIYGANSIHLAAKFMPQGLELLLSSLDDNSGLVDMKSQYNCTPLHVAATSNDSLSTRYRY